MNDVELLRRFPCLIFVATLPTMPGERDTTHDKTKTLYLGGLHGRTLKSLAHFKVTRVLYHDTTDEAIRPTAQAVLDHLHEFGLPTTLNTELESVPSTALTSPEAVDTFMRAYKETHTLPEDPVMIVVTTAAWIARLLNIAPGVVLKPGAVIAKDLWVNTQISSN